MIPELTSDAIVFFQGRFMPLRDARISVLTHALHYGTGAFDGIRGYWNAEQRELYLLRAPEHYRRWIANCELLRMRPPFDVDDLCEISAELIERNGFRCNVYVRPLAFKSAERIGVTADGESDLAIIVMPFGTYLESRKGIHAGVTTWRRVEDNAIPARGKICGSYVNSALAADEARHNGFDEPILLNESGYVSEGAACNIFLLRDGRLVTPSVNQNILEGISRASVIELASREMHLAIEERPVSRSELYIADEAFFTGTAVEIAPIVRIDHRAIGDGYVGPVASGLRRLYLDAAHGRLPSYVHWLSPVYCPGELAEPQKTGGDVAA